MDDNFVNHLCPLGPEFLLSVLRLSALTTRGRFSGTPFDSLHFLKTVEKGATTLVLFVYFPYLCHVCHALLIVAFGCFTSGCLRVFTFMYCTFAERFAKPVVNACLAVDANHESDSEYGRTSLRVA